MMTFFFFFFSLFHSLRKAPHTDTRVLTSRDDCLAIRRSAQAHDRALVALKLSDLRARDQLPHPDRTAFAASQDKLTVSQQAS